jgi:hypothetical protein
MAVVREPARESVQTLWSCIAPWRKTIAGRLASKRLPPV